MKSTFTCQAAVIGGGPAGLMAAEVLNQGGAAVDVFEAMPSVGRKLLVAGKGGLNLTHAEAYERFLSRYGPHESVVRPFIDAFPPHQLREWVEALGIPTFVGSSGRVFPEDMHAGPLLHSWLSRLRASGVRVHSRHEWQGWCENGNLRFLTPDGEKEVHAGVVVLALGGASRPELGSTGSWVSILEDAGVHISPFKPVNCGFNAPWSDAFAQKYAGAPVKPVILHFDAPNGRGFHRRGEFVISAYGVEGSLIYAASAMLRDALEKQGSALIFLDVLPDVSGEELTRRLGKPRNRRSLSEHLRRRAGLRGVKFGLLMACTTAGEREDMDLLAARVKALPVKLLSPRPVQEAISSAGGVAFEELDPHLMLKKLPGVFCAGEMLDWEAPTGGYLLTACFATGRAAGKGALRWLTSG